VTAGLEPLVTLEGFAPPALLERIQLCQALSGATRAPLERTAAPERPGA